MTIIIIINGYIKTMFLQRLLQYLQQLGCTGKVVQWMDTTDIVMYHEEFYLFIFLEKEKKKRIDAVVSTTTLDPIWNDLNRNWVSYRIIVLMENIIHVAHWVHREEYYRKKERKKKNHDTP